MKTETPVQTWISSHKPETWICENPAIPGSPKPGSEKGSQLAADFKFFLNAYLKTHRIRLTVSFNAKLSTSIIVWSQFTIFVVLRNIRTVSRCVTRLKLSSAVAVTRLSTVYSMDHDLLIASKPTPLTKWLHTQRCIWVCNLPSHVALSFVLSS